MDEDAAAPRLVLTYPHLELLKGRVDEHVRIPQQNAMMCAEVDMT